MADDRIKVSGMTEATDTQMTDDAIIQVAVTEQSASTGFLTRKSTLARLANYILNKHNLVNLAGLTQTVKSAFQSVLDKINEIVEAIGDEPMGTTATTVTGAIAEHESDISELNSNLNTKTDYSSQYTNSLSTSPDSVSIIRKGNIAHVVILYPSVSFSADTAVGVLPPDIKASALTIFRVVNRTSGAPMSGTVWLSANQNNIRYYGTAFSNTRVAIEGVVSLDK